MICYNVFLRGDEVGKDILIGAMPERRSDQRIGGNPDLLGGLHYARQIFEGLVKDLNKIFVAATNID
jgi:hypothetical protein